MPFWYFLTVPKLPTEVSHQSNTVEIRKYLLKEGDPVDLGTPVALVENYWGRVRLRASSKGILQKTFFRPGTHVKIGDPIAIIGADGEELPYDRESSTVEIAEIKREKPRS